MIHLTWLRKHGEICALLALLLFAAALRFYKLDAQSLWYDEGNSARIAERSVQLIVEGAAGDIHPPLYYLMLKVWRSVFGSSELGLRSLSVVCGVLLVLFAFLMGRAWCNRRVGFIAAVLISISPFAIYYSQETRMYALLAVWAAVSTWALMRMTSDKWRVASGMFYILATAAGLYTQYAYPFVMVAQGGCVLVWLGSQVYVRRTLEARRTLRHLAAYALLNLIPILFYTPWLPIAIRQIRGWAVAPQAYELGPAILDALRWLVVGRTLPLSEAMGPMAAFGVCVFLGLVVTQRSKEAKREMSLLLCFFVLFILAFLPLALLFVFKLYRDAYLKFLLVCLAPLCLLAAMGMDAIGQTAKGKRRKELGFVFSAALVVPCAFLLLPSLNNLYNNPAYARDDYRSIAALIQENDRADDAVLFIAPNQWEVFTNYYTQTHKTFPLTYKPATEADVDAELHRITLRRNRLFVLYYAHTEADPNGWYERWLAQHAFKAEERWVGNIRLAVYAPPNFMAAVERPQVNFGEAIQLKQYRLLARKAVVGDVVPIGLYWLARIKTPVNYKVFIHIGKPDAPPIAQNDGEPVAGFRPTHTWQAGEQVSDPRAVWIHPGTPPGQYAIFVGLYDANTGERLKLPDGSDRLRIGEITLADK